VIAPAPRLAPITALAATAAAVALAGCGPTPPRPPSGPGDPRVPATLVGEWRWVQLTEDGSTRRTEDERWQFVPRPGSTSGAVIGRYLRDVTVQSTDGRPFDCNQSTEYHQRAMFDVEVAGSVIRETSYRAEPSPCDHGFRKLGQYTATVGEQRATLSWDGGVATLLRIGPPPPALAEPSWPGDHPIELGAWQWSASWLEPRGPRRTAAEDWEIANGPDGTLDATVVRTVETVDADGATIACAGSDRWTSTERIAVEIRRDGEILRLREVAVETTPHPCRKASPSRVLDDATAEQIGDSLVLEWRGDRRQVLIRPAGEHAPAQPPVAPAAPPAGG